MTTEPQPFHRDKPDGIFQEIVWPPPNQSMIWVWYTLEQEWVLAFVREVAGNPGLFSWLPVRLMNQDLFHGYITYWVPVEPPATDPVKNHPITTSKTLG